MPRYYCDYCDTYLTHDSPSVRKQHNAGYKHKGRVREYYQQFEEQQTQQLIDQRIKEHLGQAAAFQQVGAAYNQHHLMGQRPGLPLLPTPVMPNLRGPPLPLNPALMRPPVLPKPGYMSVPPMAPPMMAPPGAPNLPGQSNGLQGHPMVTAPGAVPGSAAPPPSSAVPSMVTPPTYQPNPPAPTGGGSNGLNINSQPPEANP